MSFVRDEKGVVAVIFAIIAIPFIALGGWGVDYLRIYHVRDALQNLADAAVFNALVENTDPRDRHWENVMRSQFESRYGPGWATALQIDGGWINATDFRVSARADVSLIFMKLIPGIPSAQAVEVQAVARLNEVEYQYEPPELAELDPEAGDYNRVWLYCFWPDRPENDPSLPRRTQMVPIADNGGSMYSLDESPEERQRYPGLDGMLSREFADVQEDYELGLDGREKGIWRIRSIGAQHPTTPVHTETRNQREYVYWMPECPRGSYRSLRLENVRFSRTQPTYWDANTPPGNGHSGRFNYYTDSVMQDNDVETYSGLTMQHANTTHPDHGRRVNMMETVLCEHPRCEGPNDRLPAGKNRPTPNRETRACEPGKYMYYGFEDRPPGLVGRNGSWQDYAWTDRDYDDIRVIVPCPVRLPPNERSVRLIS